MHTVWSAKNLSLYGTQASWRLLKTPHRQHSRKSTLCGERETIQAQKQDMKGLINRDKQPQMALQTLAAKSISQRQHPRQSQHKSRTHVSHAQVQTQSQNHCNTLQKLLVLLYPSTTCKMGTSMYLLMKWGENYKALYIFSSWNYRCYYNYSKENYPWKEVWETEKKDFCEEKEWIQQRPRWKDRDWKSTGLHLETAP